MVAGAKRLSNDGEGREVAGGGEPQGPIRVSDILIPAPDLAEHGRHIDPFALPHWRYFEVLTWIATRDFGQVASNMWKH